VYSLIPMRAARSFPYCVYGKGCPSPAHPVDQTTELFPSFAYAETFGSHNLIRILYKNFVAFQEHEFQAARPALRTDATARSHLAITSALDQDLSAPQRSFMYMPFMHIVIPAREQRDPRQQPLSGRNGSVRSLRVHLTVYTRLLYLRRRVRTNDLAALVVSSTRRPPSCFPSSRRSL
jgi:hypothetical protein